MAATRLENIFNTNQSLSQDSQKYPFVTISLITYNAGKTIERCLQSLFNLNYPRSQLEIVVVDAGSTDGTLEVLRSYPVSVILQPQRNRGRARNTLVEHSKGEILAFIDADCLATPNWIKQHVMLHDDPNILIAGGSVLQGGNNSLPTTIFHETYFAGQSPNLPRHSTWDLATCNASFKRTTFWMIGLFPEVNRGEDSLLCWQVLRKGYGVIFEPKAQVIHLHPRFTYQNLFKRTLEQGRADHEIQYLFGSQSPFRLPRSQLASVLFGPSLLTTRFVRYLVELVRTSKKPSVIVGLPVLLAISGCWTVGYVTYSHKIPSRP